MIDKKHILIIDDEENLRHMLTVMLTRQGYLAESAVNGEEALLRLKETVFDFILCDIRMPEMDGKTFLARALGEGVAAPVIMMSAYGTVETAVECMKMGAYDFISKPFKKDEIIMVLKKAEERERLKDENLRLKGAVSGRFEYSGIVSRNPVMEEIFTHIRKIADMKTTVLILGESGTGKELVARAIHTNGRRAGKPFVAVNCGAIPENLLESELFGHVRGAFTDAATEKPGLFEQADGGTLFLDEIGEMPLALQVKLLRVLQEEEIRKLGGAVSKKVNVRVVSATSRDLAADVKAGVFREDLFFRLNVFFIQLPPLRDRIEDIPVLAEYFISSVAQANKTEPLTLAPDAMRSLMAYNWPGNVRELRNVMERAVILCDGRKITNSALPSAVLAASDVLPAVSGQVEELSIKKAEEAIERDLIKKALLRTGGNRTHAAIILEISHRTLLYKLKEFGIE